MNKFLTLSLSTALFAGVATFSHAQEPTATPTDAQREHLKEVDARQTKQKDRIEAGEKSGELSTAERHDVQSDEDRIQAKKKADMEKNGGHLTKKEQRSLNASENKVGHEIYEDKHNADKTSPEVKQAAEAKHAADSKPAAEVTPNAEKSHAGEEKKHSEDKAHGDEKPQQ